MSAPMTEKYAESDQQVSSDLDTKAKDIEEEANSELSREMIPPPDGGWKAWLVVFGAFCVSVMAVQTCKI